MKKGAGYSALFVQAITQGPDQLNPLCDSGTSGACALVNKPAQASQPVSLMQGLTSATQARFSVLVPKREQVFYFVVQGGKPTRLLAQNITRPDSKFRVDHLVAEGLKPKETYELLVISANGELWDRRQFKALNPQKKHARLAVISCMDDRLQAEADRIWPQVVAQKPDAILLIGDNVYADSRGGDTPPDQLWQRYTETREKLKLYFAESLIPVLATWDDHDFGQNDGDGSYKFKADAADVFFAFFPQKLAGEGFERGPGVASFWSAFGANFALLDDRSFRTPNKQDLPNATHFGQEQEQWLDQRLESSLRPVFLISGDQFFGGYHPFESFEGSHPKSFKERLEGWRKSKVPLIFVSGDRHLTEIMNIEPEVLGYSTFEITSSGVHAKVFAEALTRNPNPRRMVGVSGKYNYAIFEIMRSARNLLEFSVTSFGDQQNILYQKTLRVKHP